METEGNNVVFTLKPEGPTMAEIWKTLSRVDVSKQIEKKGNLSYLSWAWAWGVLMERYPDATYEFLPERVHEDGTVTVFCTVKIGSNSRTMWLPVMDYKNNALQHPDARKLSDTKMRCLVKCLAMFGLGHYIYAGEDLPLDSEEKPMKHDPLDRANLKVEDDHRQYASAFIESLSDPGELWAVHNDCKNEGEEFYRAVWSLLDSKTRSAIKKALAAKEAA